MPEQVIAAPETAAARASFYRQGTWMMATGLGSGALMWAVHFLNKALPPGEYGLFGAMLAAAMCVPAGPLQMVLARQTAHGLAAGQERQVSGMIRMLWLGTLVCWVAAVVVLLCFQKTLMTSWGTSSAAGFWIMLPILLFSVWGPMFAGVLLGQQSFFWLGWTAVLNAVLRLSVAAFAVLVLKSYATGMMAGVLAGMVVAFLPAMWQSRSLWRLEPLPFDWRELLRHVVPLVLGYFAFQFLFTADTMFVKSYFTGATVDFYVSAGTMSRALIWGVGPLATVMFPRIVHSAARSEKTNLLNVVLLGTLVLSILGAVGLTVVGPWVVRLVFSEAYVKVAAELLPWYAGAMIPLALGNVLVNNLLARQAYGAVPALCVVAIAYAAALTRFHATLVMVLQVMAVFNLLFLAVCAWYEWGRKRG